MNKKEIPVAVLLCSVLLGTAPQGIAQKKEALKAIDPNQAVYDKPPPAPPASTPPAASQASNPFGSGIQGQPLGAPKRTTTNPNPTGSYYLPDNTPPPGYGQAEQSGYEKRVQRLEQLAFGSPYPEHDVEDRLDHLENEVFSQKSSSAPVDQRLARLESKLLGQTAFEQSAPPSSAPAQAARPPQFNQGQPYSAQQGPFRQPAGAPQQQFGGQGMQAAMPSSGRPGSYGTQQSMQGNPPCMQQGRPPFGAQQGMQGSPPFGAQQGMQGSPPFGMQQGMQGSPPFGMQQGMQGSPPYGMQQGQQGMQGSPSYMMQQGRPPLGMQQNMQGSAPYGMQQGMQGAPPSGMQQGPRMGMQGSPQYGMQASLPYGAQQSMQSSPYGMQQSMPGTYGGLASSIPSNTVPPDVVVPSKSLGLSPSDRANADIENIVKAIPLKPSAGDYFSAVSKFASGRVARWTSFPVLVHLPQGSPANWQKTLEDAVGSWGRYLPVRVAAGSETSDIEVAWINHLPPRTFGQTNLEVFNGRVRVTVYLLRPSYYLASTSEKVLKKTAEHEIGHALGIFGHSSDPADLMYPMENAKDNARSGGITPRDLNTLRRVYETPALPPGFQSPHPMGWSFQSAQPNRKAARHKQ